MTTVRKTALLAAKLTLTIAVGLISTACAEADRYGKETDKETVLQVTQEPYNFSIEPKFQEASDCLLKVSIKNNDEFVSGANGSATLIANDGTEQKAQFQESKEERTYNASVPLKPHADYMAKTEFSIG